MIKFKINSCDGIYDSLDVRFTKACDNRCEFCIEKDGLPSLGDTKVAELIKATIGSGKSDILILGGEPLLNPENVLEYIEGVRKYVTSIYLTTSLPKITSYGKGLDYLKNIIGLLDGINISVHHYEDRINNDVLKSTNPYDRIHFLETLLRDTSIADKVRVCCNLVSGYIDTQESINEFLIHMHNIGVKNVKLNELQNVSVDAYVAFEDVYNLKLKSPFAYGCQTDITDKIRFNSGMRVTLKRSCFCNKDRSIAKATIPDLVKCIAKRLNKNLNCTNFMVMYEDGRIEAGWLET